jgi:hypothetical protein
MGSTLVVIILFFTVTCEKGVAIATVHCETKATALYSILSFQNMYTQSVQEFQNNSATMLQTST